MELFFHLMCTISLKLKYKLKEHIVSRRCRCTLSLKKNSDAIAAFIIWMGTFPSSVLSECWRCCWIYCTFESLDMTWLRRTQNRRADSATTRTPICTAMALLEVRKTTCWCDCPMLSWMICWKKLLPLVLNHRQESINAVHLQLHTDHQPAKNVCCQMG